MTEIEIVATLFGLVCVYLTIRQNIWCWPTGLVMVSLYIFIFFQAKLYSDMGLQVVYVFLQLYGWYYWLYGGKERDEVPVTQAGVTITGTWLAGGLIGTALLGFLMSTYTDAAVPYWDAATTVLSLIAQWLMAKKILENWLFWITVDVLAIGIYFYKGLYPTTVLYAVFLGMATAGYFAWRRSMAEDEREREAAVARG